MSTRAKVLSGIGIWIGLIVTFAVIFGWTRDDNTHFQALDEFKTPAWASLGPLDFNKAVLYLLIAGALTVATMVYVAKRMQDKPNRIQTLVEVLFTMMRDTITRGSMDSKMAAKWFPFIGALFLFIWYSNLIGYLPLPTNTEHKVDVLGLEIPSFALYAATANISIPLTLAILVFVSYTVEGIRKKGLGGYLKSLVPPGVPRAITGYIFLLELISNFMRLISLSVRLFANILAGHLIILFLGGALVVLLGIEALGIVTVPFAIVIYLFEIGLVATLQAFIFAILTAIYLGGAVAESH